VPRKGSASVGQRELPLGDHGDESVAGTGRADAPVGPDNLLERVLEGDNLRRALRRVRHNRGAPGRSPALALALPGRYFRSLGLPSLAG
jgi:RNA-directed DNA polymerase